MYCLLLAICSLIRGVTQPNQTEIEHTLARWEDAGFERPMVVYWNTAGYAGSPATVQSKNIALVSGFSPSILQAILSGDGVSPGAVLNRALEKYEVIKPEESISSL